VFILSKPFHEIAAEILQEVIKARGNALQGIGSSSAATAINNIHLLEDEAIVASYKAILTALKQG
jgi:hypothetical protein